MVLSNKCYTKASIRGGMMEGELDPNTMEDAQRREYGMTVKIPRCMMKCQKERGMTGLCLLS
jgi:hypothetical protein